MIHQEGFLQEPAESYILQESNKYSIVKSCWFLKGLKSLALRIKCLLPTISQAALFAIASSASCIESGVPT